jgi:hypothetical protein
MLRIGPGRHEIVAICAVAVGLVHCAGHEAPPKAPVSTDGGELFARFKTYPRGSLLARAHDRSSGAREVGCLDVSIERVRDAQGPSNGATIAFNVGNRCTHALDLDFRRIRVTAHGPGGRETPLVLHDPGSEVRTRTLDGRARAREALEFVNTAPGARGSTLVCVDVANVIAGEPPHPTTRVCFDRTHGAVDHGSVVGHRENTVFGGSWHAGPIAFFAELSASERIMGFGDMTFSGTVPGGTGFRLRGDSLGRVSTFGAVDHFELRLLGPLYAGLMLRVLGGHLAPRSPFFADSVQARTGSTVEELGGGASLGLMSRPIGDARFRADVTAGGSAVIVDVDVPGCGHPCSAAAARATRYWVEPRLVMDAWLTPWWTVSAWGAADALRLPDFAVGLALGFHLRSFDAFP